MLLKYNIIMLKIQGECPLPSPTMFPFLENHQETTGTKCDCEIVDTVKSYDHVTLLLLQLQWLSVCFWVQFRMLIMTFKFLNSLRPGYLKYSLPLWSLSMPWDFPKRLSCAFHDRSEGGPFQWWIFLCVWNALLFEMHCASSLFYF